MAKRCLRPATTPLRNTSQAGYCARDRRRADPPRAPSRRSSPPRARPKARCPPARTREETPPRSLRRTHRDGTLCPQRCRARQGEAARAQAPAPARPPASPSHRRVRPRPLSPPRERTHLHSRQRTATRRYRPKRGRTQCQPPQAAVPKSAYRNRASHARPKAAAPTLA